MNPEGDEQQCSACRFWKRETGWDDKASYPDVPDSGYGNCRRHSPIIAVPVHSNDEPQPIWPATEGVEWCGDFEESDQSIAETFSQVRAVLDDNGAPADIQFATELLPITVAETDGWMRTYYTTDDRQPVYGSPYFDQQYKAGDNLVLGVTRLSPVTLPDGYHVVANTFSTLINK